MELCKYFRSIIEHDTEPVVICDRDHTIIYMNPAAAENYARRGGYGLVGRNLMDCHGPYGKEMIAKVTGAFESGGCEDIVFTTRSSTKNADIYMVALRDEDGRYIGYYEKHESRDPETGERYAGVL